MHSGKLVFAQLMDHLPLYTYRRCAAKYPSRYPALQFSHFDQFPCMAFAQLTFRESLRDIETCLRAHSAKLYHLGIRGGIARSTLGDANESRDWRVYQDFPLKLIHTARTLYAEGGFGVELKHTVYALVSTSSRLRGASPIDLCLALCPWARFRKTKAAVKLHTLFDLRGNIPSFTKYLIEKQRINDERSRPKTRANAFFQRREIFFDILVLPVDASTVIQRKPVHVKTKQHLSS